MALYFNSALLTNGWYQMDFDAFCVHASIISTTNTLVTLRRLDWNVIAWRYPEVVAACGSPSSLSLGCSAEELCSSMAGDKHHADG